MRKNILSLSLILFAGLIQAQIIYTYAGTTLGFSGDGGPANAAKLFDNYGMCIDASGNVYIADTYNYRIRKVNTTGIISTISGTNSPGYTGDGGPATLARFNMPYALTTDLSGNVYIADYFNQCVRKINTSGIISTFAGGNGSGFSGDGGLATAAQFNAPWALASDAAGNIYIHDTYNYRIRKVSTSGIITTVAGTGTVGFSGDGGLATAAQINPNRNGMTFDAAGNMYICDGFRIRKINTAGIISTIAGTGVSGFSGDGGLATSAQISAAIGITIDPLGNIYIADGGNYRIRKINTSGIISTVAGTGTMGSTGDGGPAVSAQVTLGYGIASDAAGNVYINDKSNNKIRVICMGACPFITEINSLEKENTLSVFPNPNNGSFKIEMNNEVLNAELVLYNALGQKMFEQKLTSGENTISTGTLAKGLYHYVISQNDVKSNVGKIVVE